MINLFAPKRKENVAQIGGAMGGFDEEFEQGLETPKGSQILGSITFNLPNFAPAVSEVVDSFYGLFRGDVFGRAEIQPEDPNAEAKLAEKRLQQETVSFTRQRNQALEEAAQRLSMQRQEKLMKDALRMGVNVIDVVTEVASNITNPIQAQREAGRMEALGISDVVTVVNKVEVRDAQVEEAEEQQVTAELAKSNIVIDQDAAPEGGMGRGQVNTGAVSGAG